MEIRAFSLDFIVRGDITFPTDTHLHDLAIKYIETELAGTINLTDYRKVLLTCELGEDDKPLRVIGIACGNPIFDWPVLRFTEKEAGPVLFERMRHYLQDNGMSGHKVFIHVADHEPKESRCPFWRKWLRKVKATKASRWIVQV